MHSKTGFMLDTVVTIKIYNAGESILDEAFELCKYYEKIFSKTIGESDISRLNLSEGKPVKVSDDTIFLLKRAIYYSNLSQGKFDVTIYPVSALYDFKSENPKVPADEEIKEALKHVDYNNIVINGNEVTLKNGAQIDLGGIAKGYIADKIKEFLISKNVKSAIINLGGNVLLVGEKPKEGNFVVGVRKPFADGELIGNVHVKDVSVVGSGTYERYFKVGDTIYHHILDVKTGKSVQNSLDCVMIIAKNSVDADALSTIAFILGYEEGSALIESLPDTEAIFIFKDLSVKYTSGITTDKSQNGKIYFELN